MTLGDSDNDDNDEDTFISSPGYPHAPPPHTECVWVVMAPAGKRVQIEFVEQFYLTPSYR